MISPALNELDRQGLAGLLSPFLAGRGLEADQKLVHGRGPVKSYGLEVDGPRDAGAAAEFVEALAHASGMQSHATNDDTLLVMGGNDVVFFVDVLDPRFWLLHTVSASGSANSEIRRLTWNSNVDVCWFPQFLLENVQSRAEATWFKADFRGGDLLPLTGVRDRRLRIQVEGDGAFELLNLLRDTDYRTAAALTGVATRLGDSGEESALDEVLHFNGRFVARGESFDTHVGFVAGTMREYATLVSSIENEHRITWTGSEETGFELDGEVVTIEFGRPIMDMPRFVEGLFSCRDPFRLWGIPRQVAENYYTAQAVDLHIGERITIDVARDKVIVYLTPHACGNTALRLLANLQHRYDATASFAKRVA